MNIKFRAFEKILRFLFRFYTSYFIEIAYRGVLRRDVDSAGFDTYSRLLKNNFNLAELINELINSDEFWINLIEDRSSDLVQIIHRGLLGLEPQVETLKYYADKLSTSHDILSIIKEISLSDDYLRQALDIHAENILHSIYNGLLDRNSDTTGLENYKSILNKKNGLFELLNELINSKEFINEKIPKIILKVNKFIATEDDLKIHKLIFLHLPKTGGTTMHNILIQNFKSDQICPERFNGLGNFTAVQLIKYRLFSGHFDLPSTNFIPGFKNIITMLRNPIERLISFYYFQKSHKNEVIENNDLELARLANKYSIADFFMAEEVRSHPAINNAMTMVLTQFTQDKCWLKKACQFPDGLDASIYADQALKELKELTAFGIMERYEESVDLIFSTIKLPFPHKIEKMQVLDVIAESGPGLRKIFKEPVTQEIRALIAGLVKVDMFLYQEACKIFDQRIFAMRELAK